MIFGAIRSFEIVEGCDNSRHEMGFVHKKRGKTTYFRVQQIEVKEITIRHRIGSLRFMTILPENLIQSDNNKQLTQALSYHKYV